MAIDTRRLRPVTPTPAHDSREGRRPLLAPRIPLGNERAPSRRIRHLRLRSVVRFAAVFYASLYVLFLVAGIFLWVFGRLTGAVASLEDTLSDLSSTGRFAFAGGQVFLLYGLAVAVVVGLAFVATVVLGAIFNLVSDVVGGFEVTLSEDDGA